MSLYFVNVVVSLFYATFFAALNSQKNFIKANFLPFFGGIFFGCFVYFLNQKSLNAANNLPFFQILALIFALILPFCLKFKNFYFHIVSFLIFGLAFGYIYSHTSADFKVFVGEILDSLSLKNLFFLIFGFLVLFLSFWAINFIKFKISKLSFSLFLILSLIIIITDKIGFLTLSLMQSGKIETHSQVLSIVAKILYFHNFLPFVFALFSVILGLLFFISRPKKTDRSDIIKFRQNEQNRKIRANFLICVFVLNFIICAICLYFIKIESAPLKIGRYDIIEPKGGIFEFDAKIANDNELHRFAYITDEGKEVRFFIVNRFKDKLSPVIVFDACSICGDMGYLKKGDDLICISCNVRIFLPSVGKVGGCNPIPMNYEYDGKTIKVTLKEIESGASFFSKVVEKMVIDPVSHKKIKNDSKFRHLYYGRTYFFENEQNLAEFEKNAEKYVSENGEILGLGE